MPQYESDVVQMFKSAHLLGRELLHDPKARPDISQKPHAYYRRMGHPAAAIVTLP
jgi:hypothetical protein